MEKVRRNVWVLGAGFSRPLGGPLLRDLFLPEMWDRLSAYYPERDYPKLYIAECRVAHALFNYGIAFQNGPIAKWPPLNDWIRDARGEHIWPDAEDFLAELDTAAEAPKSPAARRIEALTNKLVGQPPPPGSFPPSSIRDAAKRLVAAECSAFLLGA